MWSSDEDGDEELDMVGECWVVVKRWYQEVMYSWCTRGSERSVYEKVVERDVVR